MSDTHSKSGLDRILTANAVSSFIGTSFEAHRSDADARRAAGDQCMKRALALTSSPLEAIALFNQAMAWAEDFVGEAAR